MSLQHVTTDDGVDLAVRTWPANRGTAPTVLGLHGFSATHESFAGLARELRGEVELIAVDHRGRGRSGTPADPGAYGMRRHAEDAATVLRSLGRTGVVVVGQSMGAWIATQLAAHHPDLVAALVLVDGGCFDDLPAGADPVAHSNQLMAGLLDRLDVVMPSADLVVGALAQLPVYAAMWDDEVEAVLRATLVEVEGGVRMRLPRAAAEVDSRSYFTPLGGDPDVRADLVRVACPVHLLRAPLGFAMSHETMTPIITDEALAILRRRVRQLTVDTVEGFNHYSVNFSAAGAALAADAVRRALA